MTILRTVVLLVAFAVLPWTQLYAAAPTPAPANAAAGPAPAKPASPPAAADELPKVEVPQFPGEQTKLDGWKAALDHIDATLHARTIGEDLLSKLRDQATAVQSGARDLIAAISPRLDTATTRLKQLEPAKGTPTQSDALKAERAKLQAEVTGRQGILQQAQLADVRAKQALDAIAERRRAMFTNSVLRRSQSLINPSFWITVAGHVPAASGRLLALAAGWGSVLAAQPVRAGAGILIVLIALAGFLLSPGPRWLARWTDRDPAIEDPGPLRRSTAATAIVLANLAIPGIAMLVLYQALVALGVLPSNVAPIVRAVFYGLTFIFFFIGLTTATLAPGRPNWRLIGLEDAATQGLVPVAVAIALITAAGIVLDALNRAINATAELSTASHGVVAVVLALLFMAALRVAVRAEVDAEGHATTSTGRSAWRLLIPVGWVVASAAVLGPIAGFIPLGRFASGEMLTITTVLMSLVLLSGFADAVIGSGFAPGGRVGRFMRQTVGLRTGSIRQISVILSGFVQLLLIVVAAFIILTTLGIQSTDVLGSMTSAFFGFKIGNFTISPSAILGALAVLVIGMAATRAIQRWLEGRYLPETNLDVGMRSSIRTGVGYVGVILAVIVAFSFAGLNLQNIAIVAGALSVGIGFGLQSIVNNFVSGLILLVERPIKVGDRIEVGTRMGIVRRINVRATEIMTYDNVSVIVPNADLISGQVVNWMHGSASARLSVTVGASYSADPDQVIAVLLDVVDNNAMALKIPAPFAIFTNFGADALEFMVFFHVGNISTDAGAANAVRLEILKRFRQEGIEVPFAQRDLHLRDIDRLEALVREVAGASGGAKPTTRSRRGKASPGKEDGGESAGE